MISRCASPSPPSPAWAARDSQCRKQSLILRTPLQGCYHHHCIELDKFDWIFCFAMAATLRSLFWPNQATFLGHPRFARSDKKTNESCQKPKLMFLLAVQNSSICDFVRPLAGWAWAPLTINNQSLHNTTEWPKILVTLGTPPIS